MTLKIAFYKGSGTRFDKLIRWWMRGPYSHTEMILEDNGDGTYTIASSVPGIGVRIAEHQTLPDTDWDFVTIPGDIDKVRAWFERHDGARYDYLGLFGFVLRPVTILDRRKFWCSQACMRSLGFMGAWREDPNGAYDVVKFFAAEARLL